MAKGHMNIFSIANNPRNANQNQNVILYLREWLSSKRPRTTNVDEKEIKGTFVHCCWECNFVHPLWKTVHSLLKKLKIKLSYDPEIPVPGIYPKKVKVLN